MTWRLFDFGPQGWHRMLLRWQDVHGEMPPATHDSAVAMCDEWLENRIDSPDDDALVLTLQRQHSWSAPEWSSRRVHPSMARWVVDVRRAIDKKEQDAHVETQRKVRALFR